jgi:competence ComEA-like helix-hairpin-helix protein
MVKMFIDRFNGMVSARVGIVVACLIVAFLTGCSARGVYQSSANLLPASSNAININTASVDDLEKLPHIGRKTADAIVQFRAENGAFRRIENLMQVRGISEKRFLDIRPLVRTE